MADMDVIVNGLARRLYEAGGEWCEGSGIDTHPWLQADPDVRAAFKQAAKVLIDKAA